MINIRAVVLRQVPDFRENRSPPILPFFLLALAHKGNVGFAGDADLHGRACLVGVNKWRLSCFTSDSTNDQSSGAHPRLRFYPMPAPHERRAVYGDCHPKADWRLPTSFAEMQTVCIYQYEQRQTGQRPGLDAAWQPCGKVGVGVTPRYPTGVDAVAAPLPATRSRAGPRASAGARPGAAAEVPEEPGRPENG